MARYGALDDEGKDDAEERGLRIEEDKRRGIEHSADGRGCAGTDGGRGWTPGEQGELLGPAERDGRAGLNGSGRDIERAAAEQRQPESSPEAVSVFRIPASMVETAVGLGADLGLSAVILQTADETPQEVGAKLVSGDQQFWAVSQDGRFTGSVITQIEIRAGERILVVKYLAGPKFKDWLGVLHETMTAFAKEIEATAIETHSREALRKTLLGLGWKKVAVLYRMTVDG